MKKLLFVAVVAFAAAVIGPPAAFAAPGSDAQIAIERAAPAPAIVQEAAVVALAITCSGAGGKLDVISPATPAAIAPRSLPGHVAAAVVLRDDLSVAHPLLL